MLNGILILNCDHNHEFYIALSSGVVA